MRLIAMTLLASTALAGAAQAEIGYAFGEARGYNLHASGEDSRLSRLRGGMEATDGALTFGLEYDNARGTVEDETVTATNLLSYVGYDLNSAFTLGAGFSGTIAPEGEVDYLDAMIGGEYRLNDYTLGLGVMQSGLDGWEATTGFGFAHVQKQAYAASFALTDDGTDTVVSAIAEHQTERYTGTFSLLRAPQANMTVASAELAYLVSDKTRLLGEVTQLYVEGEDATKYGIGAGYALAPNLWADLETAQLRSGGETGLETISLGLSYKFGAPKLKSRKVLRDMQDLALRAIID